MKKKDILEGLYVPMWMVRLKQDRISAVWHTLLFALYKNGNAEHYMAVDIRTYCVLLFPLRCGTVNMLSLRL